jgi:hypothetical protein
MFFSFYPIFFRKVSGTGPRSISINLTNYSASRIRECQILQLAFESLQLDFLVVHIPFLVCVLVISPLQVQENPLGCRKATKGTKWQ